MAERRDKRSQVAIEVFVYRIQKYIGAYVAAMNGIDIVVFTGGIGENNPGIRERVAANLEYLGAEIDRDKNAINETVFSSDESRVTLMRIPANEEMVIAKQTFEILTQSVEHSVQNTSIGSS
jgi:acetate kinase